MLRLHEQSWHCSDCRCGVAASRHDGKTRLQTLEAQEKVDSFFRSSTDPVRRSAVLQQVDWCAEILSFRHSGLPTGGGNTGKMTTKKQKQNHNPRIRSTRMQEPKLETWPKTFYREVHGFLYHVHAIFVCLDSHITISAKSSYTCIQHHITFINDHKVHEECKHIRMYIHVWLCVCACVFLNVIEELLLD